MRNQDEKKQLSLRQLFSLIRAGLRACRGRLILGLAALAIILVLRALRRDTVLMRKLSSDFVQPVHHFLSRVADHLPFSLAEALILLTGLVLVTVSVRMLYLLIRGPHRLDALWKWITGVAVFGICTYAGFCLLWGIYYYGDDFRSQAGIQMREISVDELEVVTLYFASLTNEYASQMPRDDEGICSLDRSAVLEKSRTLYRAAVIEYPWLDGPEVRAKGWLCSKLLSLTDFSGFFFPFTAEANVNLDFPSAFLPSTVAHELAHQRGVAKEQEANFCAVLASLADGDPEYCYSACLLAYTHLGNALYSVNPSSWQLIYAGLDQQVKADFSANRAYWAQFETSIQTVSNTVYEDFLYSYDQDLGLRSYGACVDLLVLHYVAEAKAYFHQAG